MKCDGLTDTDARRALLPSSPAMSVAGLVSHLCWVEHSWFEVSFLGSTEHKSSTLSDPLGQTGATGVSLTELLDSYDEQCARSRAIVAARGLDELEAWAPEGMELVSLRWIMCHTIEETARHLGHLDAIRELVDGMTGY
jgi:hypothetical protein